MSTVNQLKETALWFSDLSRNASSVKRAYNKAAKLAQKASVATKKAIKASQVASKLAEEVLGGHVTDAPVEAAENLAEMVPLVVTNEDNHQRLWTEWFASVQKEVDEETRRASGTNTGDVDH